MLTPLLGHGRGLTPSGDDFILGVLLLLSRYTAARPSQDFAPLIEAAYQKTTTVSANLLEAAARGLADERLIEVLEALMSAPGHGEESITALLGWGSSSGVDALAGMLTALHAVR